MATATVSMSPTLAVKSAFCWSVSAFGEGACERGFCPLVLVVRVFELLARVV